MSELSTPHHGQMIMTSQWPTFFSDLAENHRGRPVSVQSGVRLRFDDPLEDLAPLIGIDYQGTRRRDKELVISTERDGAVQTFTLKLPMLVWAAHDVRGSVVAVDVIAEDDSRVVLRFV